MSEAMDDLPDGGAGAAHVWIDILSAAEPPVGQAWRTSVRTALPRFLELGAVTVEPAAHVDITGVTGSGALIMQLLAQQLLDVVPGSNRDELIAWLREQIDAT